MSNVEKLKALKLTMDKIDKDFGPKITKENIGLLHEKLTVKLEKTDYLPSFEKALKDHSKKANIPGFRKGMVPAGLIKKMYGPSLFTDEVLRSVDRELIAYLQNDKLDIFAQPLPLETDIRQLDVNNPADYSFHFEVGMKQDFQLADLGTASIIKYVVTVTDEMINTEIARLQNRYGNMLEQHTVTVEDNELKIIFIEVDENANEKDNGITKENSLMVKYFKENFRSNLIGKTINDYIIVQLDNAFDEKELEFITGDLGLDKNDPEAAQKHFKIQITKILPRVGHGRSLTFTRPACFKRIPFGDRFIRIGERHVGHKLIAV